MLEEDEATQGDEHLETAPISGGEEGNEDLQIVHLKRFEYVAAERRIGKSRKVVDFPLKYVSGERDYGRRIWGNNSEQILLNMASLWHG